MAEIVATAFVRARKTLDHVLSIGAAFLIVVVLARETSAEPRVIMHVAQEKISWGDGDLQSKLLDRLSGSNGLSVTTVGDSVWMSNEEGTPFVSVRYLIGYGMERGARYIIDIANVRTDLSVRKGFSVPLALSRYSAVGAVSGTIRIIDSERGRLVHEEDFEVTKRGPSDWQVFENNPNSGALVIPASEKPGFLESLEWRTADKLANTILKKLKLR